MDKKRIVKDYDNLPAEIIERVKVEYPYGFEENLITFTNREGYQNFDSISQHMVSHRHQFTCNCKTKMKQCIYVYEISDLMIMEE